MRFGKVLEGDTVEILPVTIHPSLVRFKQVRFDNEIYHHKIRQKICQRPTAHL